MTTANKGPAMILDSRTHVLPSAVVGDDYQLDVSLPEGYAESSQRYPVLYVLDSPGVFGLVVPIVMAHVWEELLPKMIVVGIGTPVRTLDEWWPVRSRDYSPKPLPDDEGSGHSEAFRQALHDEILPFVDSTYRTEMADRTIWGHSLGAVFAIEVLLKGSGLFHRFIATSPGGRIGRSDPARPSGGRSAGAVPSSRTTLPLRGFPRHRARPARRHVRR